MQSMLLVGEVYQPFSQDIFVSQVNILLTTSTWIIKNELSASDTYWLCILTFQNV